MKLNEVTPLDGKMCAQLLNLLKAGRWELSGPDIAAHTATVQWVHSLAGQMAEQLKSPPTSEGFRVKAMGPIGSKKKSK